MMSAVGMYLSENSTQPLGTPWLAIFQQFGDLSAEFGAGSQTGLPLV